MQPHDESLGKVLRRERLAFAALVAGAAAIGFAPLVVRWSEVGPAATGFYRMLFAVPVLLFLAEREERVQGRFHPTPRGRERLFLVLGGLFFAADLAFWHWSLHTTTVANATLFTNLAPVWVVIAAFLLLGERPRPVFLVGLVLAIGGAALLVGSSLQVARDQVLGDLLGITSGVFYAGYQLCIKRARAARSTLSVMTVSTAVSALGLAVIAIASGESLLAATGAGWGMLLALALISQVGGQGLIGYGLAHLPSGFSSVTLLVQPLVATLLAWLYLSEVVTTTEAFGGAVILAGIVTARLGSRGATRPRPSPV